MDAEPVRKLRVTLVLPHRRVPLWLRNILLGLHEADRLLLKVVVLATERCPYESGLQPFFAWKWLDSRVFGRKSSGKRQTERLTDLQEDLEFERKYDFSAAEFANVAESIQPDQSDLIIWMAFERPPAELISRSGFGVWTLGNAVNAAAGFRELVSGVPVTVCHLVKYGAASDEDRVLACAFVATDRLLLSRGIVAVRANDQALLMSMINRAHRRGGDALSASATARAFQLGHNIPGLPKLLWGLGRIYGRYVIDFIKGLFYFDQWQLAYRIGGSRLDQEGLTRLAPLHKGFWADPFVVARDGRTFIFFEELPEDSCRGNISAIEIHADGSAGQPRIVLQCDCHLSYPFLFEFEDTLYMVPESGEAGRVEVFRSVRFPDRWEPYAVLLDGVCAFDPTLVEHEGRWWLFVTIQRNGNSTDDELHLYHAPGPFDEWTPHPLNPIRLDVRSARPAGALFREKGELFRPAQDCSVRYGYAISIQKVLRMTTEEYEEVEVRRILPGWAGDARGTHTINQSGEVIVYDYEARLRK
jgi:hypothetical protein